MRDKRGTGAVAAPPRARAQPRASRDPAAATVERRGSDDALVTELAAVAAVVAEVKIGIGGRRTCAARRGGRHGGVLGVDLLAADGLNRLPSSHASSGCLALDKAASERQG